MFENLKMSDENEDMVIWNFTNDMEEYSSKRGCIMDKENRVVCPSLGFIFEISRENEEENKERLKDMNLWRWSYSVEGTMLRLFFYKNKWYLSTHKKISAFHSRWSCKFSFGELFTQTLEEIYGKREDIYEWFLSQLSEDKIYYFLLRSNFQNRIICHTSRIETRDKIIYIGYKNNKNYELDFREDHKIFEKLGKIPYIEDKFHSLNHLYEFIEKNIDPFEYQGLFGYNTRTNEFVKIMNSRYKDLVKVRGNNHNLRFRYLEVRKDKIMVEKLYMLYPKFSSIFDEYERFIYKIAKKIYKVYVERFLNMKYVTLPKEEYIILKKCYDWFLKNKQEKISINNVLQIINNENPYYLYKMIQRIRNDDNIEDNLKRQVDKNSFDSLQDFYKMDVGE